MPETLKALNRILARALRELGAQGATEKACELAAEAWSALREADEKEAERMNGVLHQLTSTRCGCEAHGGSNGHADRGSEGPGRESGQGEDFELEVRFLPPAARHQLIFETFRKLRAGQGFVLVNDHDPKPLYYQFAFEHPDQFTWSAIESGPEVWRVRIGKP